jgi:hypothetical protein
MAEALQELGFLVKQLAGVGLRVRILCLWTQFLERPDRLVVRSQLLDLVDPGHTAPAYQTLDSVLVRAREHGADW